MVDALNTGVIRTKCGKGWKIINTPFLMLHRDYPGKEKM